ncbi:hypothetical protein Tco_0463090 [Tanacetum coccineum]
MNTIHYLQPDTYKRKREASLRSFIIVQATTLVPLSSFSSLLYWKFSPIYLQVKLLLRPSSVSVLQPKLISVPKELELKFLDRSVSKEVQLRGFSSALTGSSRKVVGI